ncbi:hypothetical protein AWN90_04220 [Nocardia terpenica]|uniref:Uncharacterized protein n=1 Tax=Nocardia terpenica TaxID=455432 RepID=A0A164IX70_9NOCA|nr:hypothetical protein AWN90_04220 [Nocardia terpenica]
MERNFGVSIAKAYAGHAENNHHGAITIYTVADIVADIDEVDEALSWLTREQHPRTTGDYSAGLKTG